MAVFKCRFSFMLAREGDVVGWVEIARGQFEGERQGEEVVDQRCDVAAAFDCERAVWWAEVVLPAEGKLEPMMSLLY